MSQEFYLVCISCKKKIWIGRNSMLSETDAELHDIISNYLCTLRLLNTIWHTRFVLFDDFEKFVSKHIDKRYHYLRIVGDEEDDYDKFREFEDMSER